MNGWSPHEYGVKPGSIRPRRDFPPVKPGRVVGLGAICDLRRDVPTDGPLVQSFSVSEFATLEDARRVTLHEERGFTTGIASTGGPVHGELRDYETLERLTRSVLNVVLPDEDDGEKHPWEWLAGLAQARGLEVTADDLRELPYEVDFTDAVRRWLEPG